MDIPIEQQFDINDKEWTRNKCRRFLRFVQKDLTSSRIEKEPGDENRLFLPKYFKLVVDKDREFYKWKSKELFNIFVAIFRFLHEYYPDINRLELHTNHSEKINEWSEYLADNSENKEAQIQNKFINEVNVKWLPGFEYLYDFEYKRGVHRGDLIFADNHGILAAVETKTKWKNVKNQTIKYRNILMEETENDPRIITVIGCYFVEIKTKERRGFPKKLKIDEKIWMAIKKVNDEFNKKSPNSNQLSTAHTMGSETSRELEEEQETDDLDLET
ncbi:hypothetical protein C1645_838275 [Glomus cerebriforme]|uniref:Uncharacterized protein n=1 Tax=Glomus cerebriforme TaxID=658196 RepID=A0A397S2P5_9GLOM|nr:hypothetical protein C1645_838275 [Glomus cerebriforme]